MDMELYETLHSASVLAHNLGEMEIMETLLRLMSIPRASDKSNLMPDEKWPPYDA